MNVLFSPSSHPQVELPPDPAGRRPLRVLLVEDNHDDVLMVLRTLRRAGYEPDWEQVETAEGLARALAEGGWEIVLSDYNMPQFDALQALQTLRERSAHLPFIVISGSIGEETAVAAMRAGADDYVMKTNLSRLIPALERELRDAAERRDRARTQEALADLQEKFQVVFHEYLDVMLVIAGDGTILHVNHAVQRTMGYDDRQLIGQSFASLWPRKQRSLADAVLASIRRDGSAFYSGPFCRLDGSNCPMDLQASKVPWSHGEAVIVTLRDVTERQRADQRLRDEKEQLAVTLRSMGDGVITTDAAGLVVLLNGTAEQLTGWSQGEAKGRPLSEILPLTSGEETGIGEELLLEVLRTGDAITINRQVQIRNRTGRLYTLALKAAPITTSQGGYSGVVAVFRDATVEQKIEEDLQKASKLESVALLAGGIAHDFNNILTAMLGHLALARATEMPTPQVLASIEKACLYATDLTRQLLSFARGNDPVRRRENVAEIIEESVRFALHGTKMRCCFDLAGDLWRAELDRGQINQVVNNLVINAAQASGEGGILHVGASNVVVGREERVATLKTGDYVRISFRDHGSGISPEHLARIFDPYFTTKPTGSGLGLATSYSIIKKHGGLIRVESEAGEGTTFTIYLPVEPDANPSLETPKANLEAPAEPRRSGGRVLFMDDEDILQELVAAMLEHLGYEVACAGHGQEAVRLYVESLGTPRSFDVVIVDLTVPGGMGGQETMRCLLEFDPGAKVVVSSGYSNDPIMAAYREHGFSGVIAKPYQMAELDKVLADVLRR